MKNMSPFVEKFTTILLDQGFIQKSEADALKQDFYDRSKDTFDFFLLDEGLISKEKILKALSIYYQVPSIDIVGIFFDHYLLTNFPKDFLIRNMVIPYQIEGEILTVIANNPADEDLSVKIEKLTDYNVEFLVGLGQPILDAIEEYYDLPPEGNINDLTDEDELEDDIYEKELNLDELIDDALDESKINKKF